jgi:hypothetical protein
VIIISSSVSSVFSLLSHLVSPSSTLTFSVGLQNYHGNFVFIYSSHVTHYPPPPFYHRQKRYVAGKIMKVLPYNITIILLAWVDISCRSLLQIWILNSWGTYACLRILFKGTSRICEFELIVAWKIDDFWILFNENLNTNVRMSWEMYFYMLKVFVSSWSSYLSMCYHVMSSNTISWLLLNLPKNDFYFKVIYSLTWFFTAAHVTLQNAPMKVSLCSGTFC